MNQLLVTLGSAVHRHHPSGDCANTYPQINENNPFEKKNYTDKTQKISEKLTTQAVTVSQTFLANTSILGGIFANCSANCT